MRKAAAAADKAHTRVGQGMTWGGRTKCSYRPPYLIIRAAENNVFLSGRSVIAKYVVSNGGVNRPR